MNELFRKLSHTISNAVGSPWAFILSLVSVFIWALLGPHFNYSETWQLVINTGTTIITFLMVFLIQNSQNRDSKAIHLKLDELIYSLKSARNDLIDLEDCTDDEIDKLKKEFIAIKAKIKSEIKTELSNIQTE